MDVALNRKVHLACTWGGVYYVVLVTLGWCLVAGFLPPHPPEADLQTVVDIYQNQATRIRIGMVIMMFGAMAYIPFTAAIAEFIARFEGRAGLLTFMQLLAGLANAIFTFYPAVWWLIASYRGDRAPELIRLLHDIGWLQLIGCLSLYLPVLVSIAIVALNDKNQATPFGRWLGYFNLWILVLVLPGQLIFFFHSGPFAWNGLLAFWMPVSIFFVWIIVMFLVMRKAIKS